MEITPTFKAAARQTLSMAKTEVAKMVRLIDHLEELLGDGPSTTTATTKAKPGPKPSKAKQSKRTPEQVNKQATEMLAFIKKAGEEGVSGREINSKFGKVIPTVKVFVETRTGEKLKTKGQRSAMRYFAA
jgi:hypothetical protein